MVRDRQQSSLAGAWVRLIKVMGGRSRKEGCDHYEPFGCQAEERYLI